MAKLNLRGLNRPARPTEERTFTDPEQPGVELTLRLAALDMVTASEAQAILEALLAEYVRPEGEEPVYLPTGGEPARLTPMICQAVASVAAAQVGGEAYDAEELLYAAICMPTAWKEVCDWATALNEKGAARGNSPAAGVGSSAPPSSSTSDTPTSSSGPDTPPGSAASCSEAPSAS